MNDIEKCAKLLGYEVVCKKETGLLVGKKGEHHIYGGWFNPLTNAQDREDLQCMLGINVEWISDAVCANINDYDEYYVGHVVEDLSNHPTKQSALAAAVVAVAVQIYDAKYGGE